MNADARHTDSLRTDADAAQLTLEPAAEISRQAVRDGQSTTDGRASKLLQGLNPQQIEAVTTNAERIRILAGAGSGKTRVLTHRIAYLSHLSLIDPRSVLAVTFTRKAAQELRSRLGGLGLRDDITAGTFHAIAFAQLRSRWAERGIRPPELLDRKAAFVGRLIRSRDISRTLDVIAEIEWAAARAIEPSQYAATAPAARRDTPMGSYASMAQVLEEYRAAKTKRRVIDFDDVLRLATRDLRSDPVYAQARTWRHRFVFVDEFQDVNPLQFQLLQSWLGADSTLCVVGDPNQAIYAWNGADSTYLNTFERHFAPATTVQLNENYRSSPQILAVANQVLSEGQLGASALRANRHDGPVPRVVAHTTDHEEGSAIAQALRDAHQPAKRWSSQAVLVRTHAQTAAISEALTAARIPHRTRGGSDFLKQPEVQQSLAQARKSVTLTAFTADLDRTIRLYRPGSADDPNNAENATVPFIDAEDPLGPASRTGFDTTPLDSELDVQTPDQLTHQNSRGLSQHRVDNLVELSRLAHDYLALDNNASVAGFVEWLVVAIGNDGANDAGDGVDIVTFHAAKGLEWQTVHIAGCETGLTPIHYATTLESGAEERRLFYVAITRAQRELTFHWSKTRVFGSKSVRRERSEYLDSVETITGFITKVDRPVRRDLRSLSTPRSSSSRSSVGGGGRSGSPTTARSLEGDDLELFNELKKWRLNASRAADVPAFVVLADSSLVQIATSRPTDMKRLLAIGGIGPTKADRFGEAILRIVGEHQSH